MKTAFFQKVLCFQLFLWLVLGTVNAQSPVNLTSGSFNCDVVAENAPAENFITCCGPDGDVVYSSTYPDAEPGTGMPASNTVTNGNLSYQLQPYDQANVMRLEQFDGSFGTMEFASPSPAAQLHFLATSVYGDTQVDIVVNFTDNTTQQIANDFWIRDWFNNTSVAYTLNGRVTCYDYVYNVNSGNPRLYTYGFSLSPSNFSKPIASVTITRTGGPETSMAYFFAISSVELTGCGNGKYLLCHVPAGNPGNAQQLCLPYAAGMGHMGNHGGCYWGVCNNDFASGSTDESKTLEPQLLNTSDRAADNSNPLVETASGMIVYFDMSPNPATNVVNIHLHGHAAGSQIHVYDQSGRMVLNRNIDATESSFTLTLEDKFFSPGIYYTTLISNNERITRQLVVVK